MLRLVSALLLTCALAGCASGPAGASQSSARTIAPATSFSMSLGEAVRLPDGAALRYVAVTQDSRCPPNVQCIRAGDADIVFEFAPADGSPTRVQVNLPEAPTKPIGAWQLTVEALGFGVAPPVTVRIDPST